MMCFSSFFAIIWQKMKKNTSSKSTDESSVTFQSSRSDVGEFGLSLVIGLVQFIMSDKGHSSSPEQMIWADIMNISFHDYADCSSLKCRKAETRHF